MEGREWTAGQKLKIVLEGLAPRPIFQQFVENTGFCNHSTIKWREVFMQGGIQMVRSDIVRIERGHPLVKTVVKGRS